MTTRALPNPTDRDRESERDAPPRLLALSLHFAGTGCVVMGVAFLAVAGLMLGLPLSVLTATGPAMFVGQAMMLFGLFLGGRPTEGTRIYWLARIATTLWGTAFALDLARAQVRVWLTSHLPSARDASQAASWIIWFVALVLFACMVHKSLRSFAARMWALVLGVCLVGAQAWLTAWTTVVHPTSALKTASLTFRPVIFLPGGLGLLLAGVGLFVLGRMVQATLDPEAKPAAKAPVKTTAKGRRKIRDEERAKLAESPIAQCFASSLSLVGEAVAAICGVAAFLSILLVFATVLGHSPKDADDVATVGGELASLVVLFVAMRRVSPFAPAAWLFVLVGLVLELVVAVLVYFDWTRGMFATVLPYLRHLPLVLAGCGLAAYWRRTSALATENLVPHELLVRHERLLKFSSIVMLAVGVLLSARSVVATTSLAGITGSLALCMACLGLVLGIRLSTTAHETETRLLNP
ncbi:hypothetical protein AKJ09_10698 [Labilithrix luteola]|uniref:Uncharacterized protein n=1 Tax=Labilithrix luteola TaxID=1391654 RepID=A0A0K1QF24_9BACT|nr:hypothetical protein [Labilithrix luteola]AKV04035.1 hypothetical protein AKJ09_10698 [Labilithrix luteola]